MSDIEQKSKEIIDAFQFDIEKILKRCRMFNYAESVMNIYRENGTTESDLAWITLFSGNFSMRKKDFEASGGFDITFVEWGFENLEFGYRLQKDKYNFYYSEDAYNIHLYHNSLRRTSNSSGSFEKFYNKYPVDEVASLSKFLAGEISLQKFESISNSGKCTVACSTPIYFIESKFGARYKYKRN